MHEPWAVREEAGKSVGISKKGPNVSRLSCVPRNRNICPLVSAFPVCFSPSIKHGSAHCLTEPLEELESGHTGMWSHPPVPHPPHNLPTSLAGACAAQSSRMKVWGAQEGTSALPGVTISPFGLIQGSWSCRPRRKVFTSRGTASAELLLHLSCSPRNDFCQFGCLF